MSSIELGLGLRERKKQRTREAIVDAAFRLFARDGFEQTTVADIAAADIAPRTFFGYFRTKEDVVFYDFDEVVARLQTRLREREDGENAIDAMRAWIVEMIGANDFDDSRERCRRELTSANPALDAYHRQLHSRIEALLAEAVAVDLDVAPDSLRPRMVGAAATAALGTIESFYDKHGDSGDQHEPDEALAIFDEALVFLRGGIAALQRKPAAPPPRPRKRR